MTNFDEKDPKSVADFALKNLKRHDLFTLATIDEEGKPWVVCLNLCIDEIGNVIWKSRTSTNHSTHVGKNPSVAICVFSKSKEYGDFGFYAKATAHEVNNRDELSKHLKVRYEQRGEKVPSVNEFLGDAAVKVYYAEITEAWINDDRHIKTQIDLRELRGQ